MTANTTPRKTKVLGVRMLPGLKRRLEEQAALEGRSVASMGRFAIEQYLQSKQRPAWEADPPTAPAAEDAVGDLARRKEV